MHTRGCIRVLLILCWIAPFSTMAAEDAVTVIRKVQDLLRADSSFARYTMLVRTPEWERTLRFDSWDDRRHRRFFVRVLAPRKDKDTTWLKNGNNLWMYIPRLERDIRIPPSMMLNSWMGSDFTNDDLVKMESLVEDYEHRIVNDDGQIMTIESIPHPDAPVVWGKLVHQIGHDHIPLRVDYYDEHGKHIRSLIYSDVRRMGGRNIPRVWTMQPIQKPGHETILTIEEVKFDIPLEERLFTRQSLRRRP